MQRKRDLSATGSAMMERGKGVGLYRLSRRSHVDFPHIFEFELPQVRKFGRLAISRLRTPDYSRIVSHTSNLVLVEKNKQTNKLQPTSNILSDSFYNPNNGATERSMVRARHVHLRSEVHVTSSRP